MGFILAAPFVIIAAVFLVGSGLIFKWLFGGLLMLGVMSIPNLIGFSIKLNNGEDN